MGITSAVLNSQLSGEDLTSAKQAQSHTETYSMMDTCKKKKEEKNMSTHANTSQTNLKREREIGTNNVSIPAITLCTEHVRSLLVLYFLPLNVPLLLLHSTQCTVVGGLYSATALKWPYMMNAPKKGALYSKRRRREENERFVPSSVVLLLYEYVQIVLGNADRPIINTIIRDTWVYSKAHQLKQ